ncbi:hypothetical protein K438DRAFT_1857462 [Mycena galopus ATCC 62051]|nr:hypothetical protein K438DRAFT_1857462 [Mycena galopus ATCC 62051]
MQRYKLQSVRPEKKKNVPFTNRVSLAVPQKNSPYMRKEGRIVNKAAYEVAKSYKDHELKNPGLRMNPRDKDKRTRRLDFQQHDSE